uniref:Acireductone dioxygenase n=1 Tax=Tabanus bromius TaxID=304241 RepID=A0A0K8TQU2_TABBR
MVQAWYMDDSTEDQRLPHQRDPPEYVSLEDLYKKCRVEYFKLNPKTFAEDGVLDSIRKTRGYSYEDEIICSQDCLPDYEKTLKNFFTEHLHTHEEIRFVLEGSGYFDVRDQQDKWIRILVTPGDLIIIPAGIYHRFTLDTNNFVKTKRYFVGEPIWLPYNRPADDMECRKAFVQSLVEGAK